MADKEVTAKIENDCSLELSASKEIKKEMEVAGEAAIKFESELLLDESDSNEAHFADFPLDVKSDIVQENAVPSIFNGKCSDELFKKVFVKFEAGLADEQITEPSKESGKCQSIQVKREDQNQGSFSDAGQKNATPSTLPGSPGIFPDKMKLKLEPYFTDARISISGKGPQKSESTEAETAVKNEGTKKTGCNKLSIIVTPLKTKKLEMPPLIPIARANSLCNKILRTANPKVELVDLTAIDVHCTDSDEEQFFCDACSAQFKNNVLLEQHLMSKPLYACDKCSARFHTKTESQEHWITHSLRYDAKYSDKPFVCEKCPARFKRNLNLEKHYARHAGEKQFWCKQCSARCKSLGRLKRHLLIHSDQKPFSCGQCPARFSRTVHLRVHVNKVHTAKKQFCCDLCPAQFTKRLALKQHAMVHSECKRFACNECAASFKRPYELKRHSKIHSKASGKCLTAESIDCSEGEEILGI